MKNQGTHGEGKLRSLITLREEQKNLTDSVNNKKEKKILMQSKNNK